MDEFKAALQKLGIEKYGDRIFNSSSHGELFHLADYIYLARSIDDDKAESFREWFPKVFDAVVKHAEENWKRPESVFQHLRELLSA